MPLERLELKNFQAHDFLTVEFDPGITTVIGPTDAGKSSVLRALRWVALNLPNGTGFIRDDSPAATAILSIDGRRVIRKRGRTSENLYQLDDAKFEAFGQSTVPDPISQFLAVAPVNFAGQHDPHFLISASAPEVARQLNAVVDLGVIDHTHENIGRTVRRAKEDVEAAQQRMVASKAKVESLEWVCLAEMDLAVVEALNSEKERIEKQAFDLSRNINAAVVAAGERGINRQVFDDAAAAGRVAQAYFEQEKNRNALEKTLREIQSLADETRFVGINTAALDVAAENAARIASDAKRISGLISDARGLAVAVERNAVDFRAVEAAYENRELASRQRHSLDVLIGHIATADRIRNQTKLFAGAAHKELEEKTDGRCPLCGSEMVE